ncbi:MAG: glutathione-disulfide reductase [Cyanobacteria bacterium P01_D01_bin.123]
MSRDFDLFVIGGGSGGIAAARRAAAWGARVGLAEADRWGGTCVNRGCIPKKLLVYASRFSHAFMEAAGFGWTVGTSEFEWSHLTAAMQCEIERLNGVYFNLLEKSGIELQPYHASFVDSYTVEVGDRQITADKILIAVGGKPVKPVSISGIELAMTSDDIFKLKQQPKRVLILGGGYIGVEFACILNGLGTDVTQVIRAPKVLRRFDEDLRTELQAAMQDSGIRILSDTTDIAIASAGDGETLQVKLVGKAYAETILTDTVALAATGRKPNLDKLGLNNTGVKIQAGAIAVNDDSQTTEDHIFAVGDCTNRVNLTPVAVDEGRAFADTYFGCTPRQTDYENIPTAVFSTPELATVGLTEAEARDRFAHVTVHRSHFKSTYHSLSGRATRTLMKLVVDGDTNRVLGAHMLGDHAAEIIQGVAIAIEMGATKADFDATTAIHPSVAEEFVTMR